MTGVVADEGHRFPAHQSRVIDRIARRVFQPLAAQIKDRGDH